MRSLEGKISDRIQLRPSGSLRFVPQVVQRGYFVLSPSDGVGFPQMSVWITVK